MLQIDSLRKEKADVNAETSKTIDQMKIEHDQAVKSLQEEEQQKIQQLENQFKTEKANAISTAVTNAIKAKIKKMEGVYEQKLQEEKKKMKEDIQQMKQELIY